MSCTRRCGKLIAGAALSARPGAGPLALSVNQFGGFVRADPHGARPDVQLYFNPVTYGAGDATRTRIEVDAFSGFYLVLPADAADQRRAHRHRERRIFAGRRISRRTTCPRRRTSADVVHGGRLLQRHRAHAGDPRADSRTHRTRSRADGAGGAGRGFSRARQPPCTTRSAPAAWAQPRATRSSMHACACTASNACAWWTHRCFRR